jgi:transcriptional regulator with XRE-family HTH domain
MTMIDVVLTRLFFVKNPYSVNASRMLFIDLVNILRYNLTEVIGMLDERLRLLIINLGIRKMDFAAKIGFTPSYISMILGGKKTNPSIRFFNSVANVYHVDIDWLKYGKGNMFTAFDADMSAEDAGLLEKYHLLPLSERKTVDTLIDAMLLKDEGA